MIDEQRQRMILVSKCFDKLPQHLRDWINHLPFSLHDDIILRGRKAVEQAKKAYEDSGGKWYSEIDETWTRN